MRSRVMKAALCPKAFSGGFRFALMRAMPVFLCLFHFSGRFLWEAERPIAQIFQHDTDEGLPIRESN